jgi:hypothetical protein
MRGPGGFHILRMEHHDLRSWVIRALFLLCCLMFSWGALTAQSHGLQFSGHEKPLDERTELYLTPNKPLEFNNTFDLSFDLRFQPNQESYFGYVFRLVMGTKSIDLIHGILPESPNNFQLVLNDRPSNISMQVPIESLTTTWTNLHFRIDARKGIISCDLGDTTLVDSFEGYETKEGVRIFFGAHQYGQFTTTDVARMSLRDIEVVADKKQFAWPLKQEEGEVVKEIKHHRNGMVKNPNWLLTMHSNWRKIASLELNGPIQTTFNQNEDYIYIATPLSFMTLSLIDNSITSTEHDQLYNILSTNSLLYDSVSDHLLSYSIDNNYVSFYDPISGALSEFVEDTLNLTRYWHHNNFIHPDGDLYTFGGYGYFSYNNLVFRSPAGSSYFDTIHYSGEFHPRYLAASAYSAENNSLYILGGYGSQSGQQVLNPNYYFELLEYSFDDSTFSKIYDCPNREENFCFANTAVLIDHHMYALSFSKYQFDNTLQLLEIDIDDPSIRELGSPIPFKFLDVQSNVDLFFSRSSNRLIAVTTFFNDDKTTMDVYSIAYPPRMSSTQPEKAVLSKPRQLKQLLIYLGLLFLLVGGMAIWRVSRKKEIQQDRNTLLKKKKVIGSIETESTNKEIPPGSIILFGGFQIIDQEGNDITGSFTKLLKKLLLLIMLNSLKHNKGVSSQLISETFWFDKSAASARNNRAVNIVKLKSLLEKVGKANISKDTGYWKFEYDPNSIYIDYADYLGIVNKESETTKEDILALLNIIDRGQFLQNTDADWLDVFKSEVSNDIIDTLADYIEGSKNEPDFVLHLTKCMFMFDIASEEAMIHQCRTLFTLGKHSLAKKAYTKFVKEYKTLYDEEYSRSFNSIIESGKEQK